MRTILDLDEKANDLWREPKDDYERYCGPECENNLDYHLLSCEAAKRQDEDEKQAEYEEEISEV